MTRRDSIPPLLAAAVLLAPLGCGSEEEAPPSTLDMAPESTPQRPTSSTLEDAQGAKPEPCTGLVVRECRVEHGVFEGVESCFVGVQVCLDGHWSRCLSEEEVDEILSEQAE